MSEYCCPPGSLPFAEKFADYTPKGVVQNLGDLPIYLVGDKSNRKAVIVSYDIYGFDAGRTREICDHIAAAGFLVLLPDFFRGKHWTVELEDNEPDKKGPFIKSLSNPEDILADTTTKILPFLQNECQATSISCVGFCFGGYVAYLISQLKDCLTCAAGVHSSIRIFNFHGSNESAATRLVTCPQMLLQAGNDNANGKPDSEVHEILSSLPFGTKCVLREFPEMAHGWVLRGDISNPAIAEGVTDAMRLVVEFITANS
eukprot:gene22339-30584_t